jgi:prevent-host-death family protein
MEARMRTVNIHDAKTHLSRLVEQAAKGESFVIAKAGKPLVKVVPLDAAGEEPTSRFGFLRGEFSIPDDFDRLGEDEVAARFSGDE